MTEDRVAVLWHDRDLEKLGFPDLHVGDVESKWLLGLDLSEVFDTVDKGENIVVLEDFVRNTVDRCRLLLEVKNRGWDRGTGRHQANIQQCLLQKPANMRASTDRFLVSSFDLDSLLEAHRIAPSQPLILNFNPGFGDAEIEQTLEYHPFFYGYCLPIEGLNDRLISRLRKRGKKIVVYTCNRREEIQRALELEVDILISDFPERALRLRG